jgi:hypothetical protein
MAVHFRRVPDDNDVPTEPGTYRRIREYWADYCESLGSNHTVADDGTVSPSDVCPYPPCKFHEFVVLEDWARPSTTRRATST